MSSANYKDLIGLSPILSIMPTAIRRKSLEILEQALDGELEVVDASNPFVFLLEASAANTANAIIKSQSEVLKQYRGLATKESELLIHMSDADHKDRFSKPASHHVVYIVNKNQLIANAVEDPLTNFKKAIIPKDTVWNCSGYKFYHHYPINIDISPGEDIVAYLDTSVTSPIGSVNLNIVEAREIVFDNQTSIMLTIPVDQLNFDSYSYPMTSSTGFNVSIPFTDKFYYARVFHTSDNVNWSEFTTTYTREAYDVNSPTVILSVTDGVLKVLLPQIYLSKNMVGSNARVDVYTTNGLISLDLGEFIANQWTVDFNDPSGASKNYSDAITNALTFNVSSYGRMEGGHNGLTFDELRDAVFYGLDGKLSPVTDLELENQLGKRGYNVSVQKDSVAERVYIATNKLPSVGTSKLTSIPGTICTDIFFKMDRKDLPDHLIDNTDMLTLKAGSLFSETLNGVELLGSSDKAILDNLDKFKLVDTLNDGRYFYNPFHYVLDSSNGLYGTRCYYLEGPSVDSLLYSKSNLNLGYTFSPKSSSVSLNDTDYNISIVTENTSNIVDVFAYLLFKDENGKRVYLKSNQLVLDSGTSEFSFTLETTLRISKQDKITVTNMLDETNTVKEVEIPLNAEFDIIFITNTNSNIPSNFDDQIIPDSHPVEFSAVSQLLLNVRLGRPMEPLYTRSRPFLTPEVFESYTEVVYRKYEKDIPLKVGNVQQFERDSDGKLVLLYAHRKGDYYLDTNGYKEILHDIGDTKRDANGTGIVVKARQVDREIRVFLVDAKYQHGNEETVLRYRESIPEIISSNIGEIKNYRPQLQGLTKLFYEPRSTDVSALVRINSQKQAIMETSVSFDVTITIREEDFDDISLRDLTKNSIRKILASQLDASFFSFSDCIAELNQIGGNAVKNINFTSNLPGDTVTLLDLNAAFTIKSRIVPLSTGKLGLEDAISFTWLKG